MSRTMSAELWPARGGSEGTPGKEPRLDSPPPAGLLFSPT